MEAGCSDMHLSAESPPYWRLDGEIEPIQDQQTLSGDFLQVNQYLVDDLKRLGLWTQPVRDAIKKDDGSVANVAGLPDDLKQLYRTAWELPQKALIDLAAARGPYIDQSQSLNLFMATPTIGKLSSMYRYAWKQGVKTTYYLRSRPATRIRQTTTSDQEAIACSLENPESCEACQ